MQVASVTTAGRSMRSEIDGWTFEDSKLLVRRSYRGLPGKLHIGYTPHPQDIPFYTCLLEMLADGWELLGPPQSEGWETDGKHHEQWCWWLQRRGAPHKPT